MSLFKQDIPVPVGGVSQLPPEIRGPGYADDLVNTFPASAKGLGVRKGTVALASTTPVDTDSIHEAEIKPAEDERYLAIIDTNGIRVVNANTGAVSSVTLDSGVSAFLAGGRFISAAVDGDLFVASRGYSRAELVGDLSPAQSNGALVTVESGRPSALYKITLDGVSVSVRTPDDPPPAIKRPAVGININVDGEPGVSLTVFAATASLLPSHSSFHNVTVFRTNYTGTVTLSTSSSSGVNAVLASTSLASGVTETTLTISATSTADPGPHSIVVTASGSGVTSSTFTIPVTVLDSGTGDPGDGTPTVGEFTIGPVSESVDIVQGTSLPITWFVSRDTGYTAAVAAGTVSPPAGITMSQGNDGLTPNMRVYTYLGVDIAMTPGSYTFTMRFVGDGSADKFCTVTVNVSEAGLDPGFAWDEDNQDEQTTAGATTGSASFFIDWLGAFEGDITIEADWTASVSGLTIDQTTLVFGVDNHVTFSWDLEAVATTYDDYYINYKASAPGMPDKFGVFVIHHTEA